MRSRQIIFKEIERGAKKIADKIIIGKTGYMNMYLLDAILEVLLDIREMLIKKEKNND